MSGVKGPDLCYARGDTAPLTLKFSRGGSAVDFTGYTAILLTVTEDEDPVDITNQRFQMDGAISATTGELDFDPQGADENAKRTASEAYVPDVVDNIEKFYGVQAIDGTGRRVTIINSGKFKVLQDKTKD